MKLLEKIKNAIFEEDEFEEETKDSLPEEKPMPTSDEIVKKIDIEKTIPKRIEIKENLELEENKEEKPVLKRERKTPIIFDEEDFVFDEPEEKLEVVSKHEEIKKPLYGGFKDEKSKGKFKPSPNISPVYGIVGVSPVLEHQKEESVEKHIFVQNKKEELNLDTVRQKAFGEQHEDDDLGLLYEMKKEDESPAISKITLGDAEEYFEDLGLEYNIDYKDDAKEKEMLKGTRIEKNKDLSEDIEKTLEKTLNIEELHDTKELEITKEQIKPKTAKEIKKVKKIEDADLGMSEEVEEPEEKNLYDLIDMMYDANDEK